MKKITPQSLLVTVMIVGLVSTSIFLSKKMFNNASPTALVTEADGETLFRNIFFSEGKLATLIPEIAENATGIDAKHKEQLALVRETIVRKIAENHPEFYTYFKKSTTSGNHLLINEALLKGLNYSNEILAEVSKSNKHNHLISQLNDIIVESGGLVYPATSGTYPGTYPGGPYWIGSPSSKVAIYSFPISSLKENSLSTDKLVDTIATTFKV